MFCCQGFEHLVRDAGKRGLAALARNTADGIRFVLQSRGVDFTDEQRIGTSAVNLNVAVDVGLRFCPFCGTKLKELVERDPVAFMDLARQHEKFLSFRF